jgi:hypothetical protein
VTAVAERGDDAVAPAARVDVRERPRSGLPPVLGRLWRGDLVSSAAAVWLGGLWLAVVSSTPYLTDDALNKDVRAAAATSGDSLLGLISRFTEQWMTNEGRFFPGSVSWTLSLFWFTGSRVAYKVVVGAVLVAAVATFCVLVARLVGRWQPAAVAAPLLFACLQLRYWYDGTSSFAGLLPLTAGLSAAALVLLVSRRGWPTAVLAAVLYGLALVTYETVLLFAPAMIAVVIVVRRSWRPALAIAVPAAIQTAIVLVLRSQLTKPPAPGYTVSLDPVAFVPALGKQMLAALPLSQWFLHAPAVPPLSHSAILLGLVLVGVPAALALRSLGGRAVRASWTVVGLIGGLGLWMWVSSAALVAVTARWQQDLVLGQGYLPVVFGYFGVALCLVSLWLVVGRLVRLHGASSRVWHRWVAPVAVGLLAAATFAGNLVVAQALWPPG